jgi:aminoglycoside 3-N-acetyltransferase
MRGDQLVRTAKNKLRSVHRKARRGVVRLFLSYGSDELVEALHKAGVEPGDSIMLHSAFEPHHGFRGSVEEAIDAFLEALGPQGNLLMVSLPYRTSSLDYLSKLKCFDVRKTPSAMGLVSEFFRRRDGVLRSAHPTHPILASGSRSEWFIEGHEQCLYPCGPGTPFEKLLQVGGKAVFFNVPFAYFTFFHYLEHHVSANLNFPLYHEPPFDVPVINGRGEKILVRTTVFTNQVIQRRRFEVLEGWLWRQQVIRKTRVGASTLLTADLKDVVRAVDEMTKRGVFFYDMQQAC